ncbi:lipase secretion chaperone [Marinobacter sp. 1Y8]
MRDHSSPRKFVVICTLAVSLGAIGLGLWFNQPSPEPQFSATDASRPASSGQATATGGQKLIAAIPDAKTQDSVAETPREWTKQPFAPSLEGTEIDGQLRADANGDLIVDLEVKDFFDYFLNTVGQVPAEEALNAIQSMARNNLPDSAAKQAMALLDSYLEYKREALALSQARLDPSRQFDPKYQVAQLRQALADLKAVRRNTMSPDAVDAFFGLEEAYGEYTVASIEIQQREDLSPEARNTLQQWQRQQLPDVIRRTETTLIDENEVSEARQQAIADADSPEDAGRKLRAQGMDSTQADDVVGYLQEREQFDASFDDYQKALTKLETSGLAADDQAEQQQALLEQYFSDEQTQTWAKLRQLSQSP